MEEEIMRAHYLLSAATACLLLTSGLAYAQSPAETKRDQPRKEQIEKDQPARGSESRSEAKPQERTREHSETGAPRQAGEEHGKPLNAAERNGAARPDEQKGARGEAAKPNERADDSRHEGAAPSAHDNRDERTKSSATPKAEKSAAEKSSQEKATDETKSKSGAAANQNTQTQRNEAAKGAPAPSQQSSQGNTGTVANEADKAKGSNEAQRGAPSGAQPNNEAQRSTDSAAQPNNEAQRGANNAAQPNSAAAASSQLPRDKEVRLSETLRRHELAPPERNLNITISIGAQIPDRVRVHRLPPEIVEITPEYRDYDYFTTDDNIVIVEPRTHRIVSQVPRDVSRSRAETQGGAPPSQTATNVAGGSAGPCQIQKRDASGQLTEVEPTTVGSSAQGRSSIAIIVQTPDQRSSSPIALDVPAGQIVVATQGPGDCRVTIEPEPAK